MIKKAKEKSCHLSNVSFLQTNLKNLPKKKFNLITIGYGIQWLDVEELTINIEQISTSETQIFIIDNIRLGKPIFCRKVKYLEPLIKYRVFKTKNEILKHFQQIGFKLIKEKIIPVGHTHRSYGLLLKKIN